MQGQVLWAVDEELDTRQFERLCMDLLCRTGFRDIIPIEPQDGGRDAEELPREGRGRAGEAAFFQFSKEQDWRGKLRRDADTLHRHGYVFSTLVFVTNRKVRGVDTDKMKSEVNKTHRWDLVIFARDWLRHQLEEVHPDLAEKYLGIGVPQSSVYLAGRIRFASAPGDRESAGWAALHAQQYKRAIPEFQGVLDDNPERQDVWEALAWCQYCEREYDDALLSIRRVRPTGDAPQTQSIRACILAEMGIRDRNKTLLLEARDIFKALAATPGTKKWTTLYNLANTLSALGQYEEAVKWYEDALELNASEPRIAKNLATAHHRLGNHGKELELLDAALEMDPLMPEALAAKGLCLLLD